MQIGPHADAVYTCNNITCFSGLSLSWINEIRYLGISVKTSRYFKCTLDHAKRSIYRCANAIFGKVGILSSEKVILQLLYSKCVPILLYSLEVCPLNISDIRSLDFVIDRFFTKLLKTNNINTVRLCQTKFGYQLPSVIIKKRTEKFLIRLTKQISTDEMWK